MRAHNYTYLKGNEMKKALIFLSLTIFLVASIFALSSCSILLKKTGLYEGYEYHVDNEYEITLTGYKGDKTKLEIPSRIDGYKVVGIAFDKNDKTLEKIEKIKIPKTILSISSDTFLPCTNLKEIIVALDNPEYKYFHKALYSKDGKTLICYPQGKEDEELVLENRVNKIADRALAGARNLKSVNLKGVKEIGEFAFSGCSALETVVFGSKLVSIGDGAFENCTAITSVAIPDTAERIGASAFKGCNALTEISVGMGVGYVGSEAFGDLSKITTITEYEGVKYLGSEANPYVVLIGVNEKDKTEYHVSIDTKVIYGSAFENCVNLTSVGMPNALSCIGKRAFYGCKSLDEIRLPESVSAIEEYSFYGCSSLGSVVIPNMVSEIGNSAFAACTSLSSVTLSNRTKAIGHMAFAECSAITSLELPNSLDTIGNSAFAGCTSLKNINIPSSLEFLGELVFDRCVELIFTESDGANYLGNTENPHVIFVNLIDKKATSCTVNTNTKFIYESAFFACTKLKSVTLSDGVIAIGASAFENCTDLETITIPASVNYIGETAFFGCDYLVSVTFADANGWISDGNAVDTAALADATEASLLLKAQDKSMAKLNPDD